MQQGCIIDRIDPLVLHGRGMIQNQAEYCRRAQAEYQNAFLQFILRKEEPGKIQHQEHDRDQHRPVCGNPGRQDLHAHGLDEDQHTDQLSRPAVLLPVEEVVHHRQDHEHQDADRIAFVVEELRGQLPRMVPVIDIREPREEVRHGIAVIRALAENKEITDEDRDAGHGRQEHGDLLQLFFIEMLMIEDIHHAVRDGQGQHIGQLLPETEMEIIGQSQPREQFLGLAAVQEEIPDA